MRVCVHARMYVCMECILTCKTYFCYCAERHQSICMWLINEIFHHQFWTTHRKHIKHIYIYIYTCAVQVCTHVYIHTSQANTCVAWVCVYACISSQRRHIYIHTCYIYIHTWYIYIHTYHRHIHIHTWHIYIHTCHRHIYIHTWHIYIHTYYRCIHDLSVAQKACELYTYACTCVHVCVSNIHRYICI